MTSGGYGRRKPFGAQYNQSCPVSAPKALCRTDPGRNERLRFAAQLGSGAKDRRSRLSLRLCSNDLLEAFADVVGVGSLSRLETSDGKKTVRWKPWL